MNYYSTPPRSDELWHYGIKGMRWGVRRYENSDGTLTEAGKRRYFNKKGKMKLRGYLLRKNRNEFNTMLDRHANPYHKEREAIDKRKADLHEFAKQNKINEDDYVEDYLRDHYLKTGRGYWDDPTGHSLGYRKKVVDYSHRSDDIGKDYSKLYTKKRAYIKDMENKLRSGEYTLEDYERDIEHKNRKKKR